MSDDLVERLRADELPGDSQNKREARMELGKILDEAAYRIEELERMVNQDCICDDSIQVPLSSRRWNLGALVKKKSGAKWHGCVVGFYSTDLTPTGYCVASAFEENSVQIYPESALEDWNV